MNALTDGQACKILDFIACRAGFDEWKLEESSCTWPQWTKPTKPFSMLCFMQYEHPAVFFQLVKKSSSKSWTYEPLNLDAGCSPSNAIDVLLSMKDEIFVRANAYSATWKKVFGCNDTLESLAIEADLDVSSRLS